MLSAAELLPRSAADESLASHEIDAAEAADERAELIGLGVAPVADQTDGGLLALTFGLALALAALAVLNPFRPLPECCASPYSG